MKDMILEGLLMSKQLMCMAKLFLVRPPPRQLQPRGTNADGFAQLESGKNEAQIVTCSFLTYLITGNARPQSMHWKFPYSNSFTEASSDPNGGRAR